MNFRIAQTFTTSLARLAGTAQKATKAAAFDLQLDPSRPGLSFHRVDRARDPDFWTARVNDDIRIVVHRRGPDFLLAYVDRHDAAYRWAERRRLEVHPQTGAAQIVEVRELVAEVAPPPAAGAAPRLFDRWADEALLACGVPADWLADVRAATEETLLDLGDHLPAESVEALIELTAGRPPSAATPPADPFDHADARRRFRLMTDEAELAAALDAPWEEWATFLHPSQAEFVERNFSGPARVVGAAGTGKSVVAMHRAARLLKESSEAKLLLASWSPALAARLAEGASRILGPKAPELSRLAAAPLADVAAQLLAKAGRPVRRLSPERLRAALDAAGAEATPTALPGLVCLENEWRAVIDYWGVRDWESYRDADRSGRGAPLGRDRRAALWPIFAAARRAIDEERLLSAADLCEAAADLLIAGVPPPYDHLVLDEAQDLGPRELVFAALLVKPGPNALFFAADSGQQVRRAPFSWRMAGVDVRGRSHRLRVCFRSSEPIRRLAERVLPEAGAEPEDGEASRESRSLLGGPEPEIAAAADDAGETEALRRWLAGLLAEGMPPKGIAVLARTESALARITDPALAATGLRRTAFEAIDPGSDAVFGGAFGAAKGLEFRAVAVVGVSEGVVPLAAALEREEADEGRGVALERERRLLYVAVSRARERLLVTHGPDRSRFLDLR